MESIPDQYIDALAIDYANNRIVVGGRTHGNNTENFWEANTIASNPSEYGFQNQFTGTNGNIHESWLGKLRLSDGTLMNCTYVAELAEGTSNLGAPHADPNLDNWPDPNTGWPDLNSTFTAKNALKVSSDGSVCVLGVGRRTITTANAYQKMVKPYYGGVSCWNSFIRVYDDKFHAPKYSSLIVGAWDTLNQSGGDNTEMFGVFKTADGVICVGRQKADTSGNALGNTIPVINQPGWGNTLPENESAVLVYYSATGLENPNDSVITGILETTNRKPDIIVFPNPASEIIYILSEFPVVSYSIIDVLGNILISGNKISSGLNISGLSEGNYQLSISTRAGTSNKRFILIR
jgi:hypothetical protein